MPAFAGSRSHREANRLLSLNQLFIKVYTSKVKGQLGSQHRKKAEDMVSRLGKRVCYQVDSSITQVGERLGVALGDGDRESRSPLREGPFNPALFLAVSPQGIIDPFIAPPQLCADQHALAEGQLLEMILNTSEIVLTQFFLEHCEQSSKPF